MNLEEAALDFLRQLKTAQEVEALRHACLRFMVQGWLAFSGTDIATITLYRACNQKNVKELAELYVPEIMSRAAHSSLLAKVEASTEAQLALLRAADAVAASLPSVPDDEYWTYGQDWESRLFPKSVVIEPADARFGGRYMVVRRPRPASPSPAALQGLPLLNSLLNHRIIPEQVDRVEFTLSGFRPSEEVHSPNSVPAEKDSPATLRAYSGGYETLRDWSATNPRHEGGRKVYFSEEGGIEPAKRLEEMKQHLRDAVAQGAGLVVLPELTISERLRGSFAHWCSQQSFPHDLIILAGTAHLLDYEANGERRNRAWLMRGDGVSSDAWQDKIIPYQTNTEKEDISPGGRKSLVHFIVGHWVINIMICIDFFDGTIVNLPDIAQGSLTIVPSMGNEATARGHIGRCKALAVVGDPAVVIAQEMDNHPAAWTYVFHGQKADPVDAKVRDRVTIADLPLR